MDVGRIPKVPNDGATNEGDQMSEVSFRERRRSRGASNPSPAELMQDNLECAERQLQDARAQLISARHRVASLQAATENWSEFAAMLERSSAALAY